MNLGTGIRNAGGVALAAAFFFVLPAHARATAESLPEVSAADLPTAGRDVLMLIRQGGPFQYDRDGVVFNNYEKLLPPKRRGYYHEYTVPMPGSKNRGARRIICGGPAKAPDDCFYTSDHYRSFQRIRE